MVGVSPQWNTADMLLTEARLRSLSSRVRRNVLTTVGRKAVVPMLAAVRTAGFPQVTRTLVQSFRKKVKAYASTCAMFAAVGAQSKVTQVSQYKDYRTGQLRTWKSGHPKKGPKMVNPAKYFHLAGPGRHERQLARIAAALRSRIVALTRDTLRDEVMKR